MKIKALAPWFGSKRTLGPRIVEALGPHRAYWEPFCGSMAVLFAKPPSAFEVVNDLHRDLTNLARVVAGPTEIYLEFAERVGRTVLAEEICDDSHAIVKSPFEGEGLDAERAYHYFVASWMGLNGVSGTPPTNGSFCIRFSSTGGSAGTRWRSAIESLDAWRERLAGVTILRRDAFEVVEGIEDRERTVIYVDPPYVVKGARYVHNFESGDHARLAELLSRFKRTRVVVSYYADPMLDDLYSSEAWSIVPLTATKALVASSKRDKTGTTDAPEILLVNQPVDSLLLF